MCNKEGRYYQLFKSMLLEAQVMCDKENQVKLPCYEAKMM